METTKKIILVTGATGQQGGATIRNLLEKGNWSIRALTRDPNKPSAETLRRDGVEVFKGDHNNPDSLLEAMQGVYGVFSVQPTEFSPNMSSDFGYEDEVRFGKNVANAAKNAGVQHFVYSSVSGADRLIGGRNYSKWEIEEYIRSLDLPLTILRPAWFMDNFSDPLFGLQTGKLSTAIKSNIKLQLIAVEDIGAFSALAFENPERYLGKTIEIAGDSLTPVAISNAISRAIGGDIPYVEIPIDTIRQISPSGARTFEFINNEELKIDIAEVRRLHPGLLTFNEWLEKIGKTKMELLFASGH
ncbi:NmrA/HSCARG family protein [Paenibacillus alkalitolerans]|uniref:NmrA/HSCARG family protein n=1 Tax=Paenibacillus alkalitolerans TaxID=2799335 RepID=UPI0018F3FCEC|nr:NmrA/HSCARG family protein [Paenibacillus alkalitolerans]